MKVALIRHGMTQSNLERRYLGRTDEPLCDEGAAQIVRYRTQGIYPQTDLLFCSPMLRCRQTAQLISSAIPVLDEGLRETDFGDFEGKTYEQLKADPDYIAWLETNGEGAVPNGESRAQMAARCLAAFRRRMEQAVQQGSEAPMFVVHGGSIMAILERFGAPPRPFYDYHVPNGQGFVLQIDHWDAQKRYPVCPIGIKEEEER